MRTRAWRRHMEYKIVIRRVKRMTRCSYWAFEDANGIKHTNPIMVHYVGTSNCYLFKNITTSHYDTRDKTKYSPNKGRTYWRSKGINTREYDKLECIKILKEYELI